MTLVRLLWACEENSLTVSHEREATMVEHDAAGARPQVVLLATYRREAINNGRTRPGHVRHEVRRKFRQLLRDMSSAES